MDLGLLAFVGIFALAGVGIALQVIRRRAVRARLLTLGFEPCEEQAPVLRQALLDVAGGLGPTTRRDYRVANCFRRAAGFGMVHRFTTLDVTNADPERRAMGGRFEAYLIDLRDPQRIARRPVAVYVSPSGSRVLRGLFGKLIELDAPGVPLTITPTPENGSLAAAFGEAAGKLDEVLPPEIQVRLSRAGSAGFFAAHFNAGRVALFVIPDTRDLDRQWTHVAEWL